MKPSKIFLSTLMFGLMLFMVPASAFANWKIHDCEDAFWDIYDWVQASGEYWTVRSDVTRNSDLYEVSFDTDLDGFTNNYFCQATFPNFGYYTCWRSVDTSGSGGPSDDTWFTRYNDYYGNTTGWVFRVDEPNYGPHEFTSPLCLEEGGDYRIIDDNGDWTVDAHFDKQWY